MNSEYQQLYRVGLLDDLHNYFPALLYEPERFSSIQSVLAYVRLQTQSHFNLFNRGLYSYQQTHPPIPPVRPYRPIVPVRTGRPLRANTPVEVVTETIDITPLLSPNSTVNLTGMWDELLQSLRQTVNQHMEPVIGAPTQEQITTATTLRGATTNDEQTICSICQDNYTEGQGLRKINHCHHTFHKLCIDQWFERNVHCPVCRYDIRETS